MSAAPASTMHLDLGGVVLTFVPDGELRAEPAMAFPVGAEDVDAAGLGAVDDDGLLVLSIGAVLVTRGDRKVLVDVGIGDRTIPIRLPGDPREGSMGGGALLRNLRALGVEPADIDTVLLTHLHADHVGWLTEEAGSATPTFPNAVYWVAEREWQFWARPEKAGEAFGPRPEELLVIGSRRRYLVEGAEPVEGITVVPAAGHTPGHVAFSVQGESGRAFIVGDALHCPAELLHPDMVWAGDMDRPAAVDTRRDVAALVWETGAVLVGPHFPDAVFLDYRPGATPALTPVAS